jgi:glycosyltransferase involved in cell wall biosynthesis
LRNNIEVCRNGNYSECVDCISYQLSIKKNIFNAYYFLRKFIPEYAFQAVKNIYLSYNKSTLLTGNKVVSLMDERNSYIREICSKIDLFVSPSQFLKRKFVEFGIAEDKIVFILYGFNLNNFQDMHKKVSRKLRFGFAGNILPAKGLHILIDTFNKIKKENIELRIYGKESSYKSILASYFNNIKKMAKNNNIKFMGGFENKDIAKIFAEIDVLIVPSIWHENSPLVIQEAFAAKTPVIASNIGGIPEFINNGVNGLLFNPGDVNDLKEKIEYIIENRELIERLKKNTPEVENIEDNAREIEETYNRLIAKMELCQLTIKHGF